MIINIRDRCCRYMDRVQAISVSIYSMERSSYASAILPSVLAQWLGYPWPRKRRREKLRGPSPH